MQPHHHLTRSEPGARVVDGRSAPRQQTMFVVGRIVMPGCERVCLVRNLSASGAGIEHGGDLPVGALVVIETRMMMPTRAIVRWSTASAAGLEFLEPAQPVPAGGLVRDPARILRSPRFALACDAQLWVGGVRIDVRTIDIALGGLKLTGLDAVPPIQPARIDLIDRGRTLPGRIRWNRSASTGFQFVTPLSSRELSALIDPIGPVIQ